VFLHFVDQTVLDPTDEGGTDVGIALGHFGSDGFVLHGGGAASTKQEGTD
jgi:hypothetical protein